MRALSLVAKNGFGGVIHSDFEESAWYDYLGRITQSRPIVRQTKAGQQTTWKIGDISADDLSQTDGKKGLAVCFTGGVGWLSQPETEGFQLTVADKIAIPFDITRQASCWKSAAGEAELLYLPTWISAEDSCGFFLLVIHDQSLVGNLPAPQAISSQING